MHFLLFNLPSLVTAYQHIAGMDARQPVGWSNVFMYAATIGLFSFAGSIMLACLLHAGKTVFTLGMPIVFLLSAFITYFVCVYNITFTPSMIQAVYSASLSEASQFTGLPLGLWTGCIAALSIYWVRRFAKGFLPVQKPYVSVVLLIAAAITLFQNIGIGIPFNFIGASVLYGVEKSQRHQRESYAQVPISANPEVTQDLTIVLVIGESARADHWHINGYKRETTPFIEKIPNLINFPHATSCANATDPSVSCLLAGLSPDTLEFIYTKPGFLGLFRRLGFSVHWISNNFAGQEQGMNIRDIINAPGEVDTIAESPFSGSIDSIITARLLAGNKNIDPMETDENLLPMLDRLLASHHGKTLIVVHLSGSHWSYFTEYPTEFEKFSPACKSSSYLECSKADIINAYDNSILHTDYVLNEIITRIRDRKAMLWYASDHGELLGERGLWNHLNPDKGPEQYRIPMLWWGSDSFVRSNPAIVKALQTHQDAPVSHSNIFSSILDCASAESPVINKALSLCRGAGVP